MLITKREEVTKSLFELINQFTSRHSDFLHVILLCQMTDSQLEASSQTPVDSHDFMLSTAEII